MGGPRSRYRINTSRPQTVVAHATPSKLNGCARYRGKEWRLAGTRRHTAGARLGRAPRPKHQGLGQVTRLLMRCPSAESRVARARGSLRVDLHSGSSKGSIPLIIGSLRLSPPPTPAQTAIVMCARGLPPCTTRVHHTPPNPTNPPKTMKSRTARAAALATIPMQTPLFPWSTGGLPGPCPLRPAPQPAVLRPAQAPGTRCMCSLEAVPYCNYHSPIVWPTMLRGRAAAAAHRHRDTNQSS